MESQLSLIKKSSEWLSNYSHCSPSHKSEQVIIRFASNLHMKLVGDPIVRVNMFDIIKKVGGKIHTLGVYNYNRIEGTVFIHSKNNFDIFLPEYTSPIRDMYILAHEFGHYTLHAVVKQKFKVWASKHGKGQLEKEADCFAIGFLVPERGLDDLSEQGEKLTPELISDVFGISSHIARIRLDIYQNKKI